MIDEILIGIAHPTRLNILLFCSATKRRFHDIETEMKLKPTTLNFHLKQLLKAKLLQKTPDRKYIVSVTGIITLDHLIKLENELNAVPVNMQNNFQANPRIVKIR